MAKTDKAIVCYGSDDDRLRVAILAERAGMTVSRYLLGIIRDKYEAVYSGGDPNDILKLEKE